MRALTVRRIRCVKKPGGKKLLAGVEIFLLKKKKSGPLRVDSWYWLWWFVLGMGVLEGMLRKLEFHSFDKI